MVSGSLSHFCLCLILQWFWIRVRTHCIVSCDSLLYVTCKCKKKCFTWSFVECAKIPHCGSIWCIFYYISICAMSRLVETHLILLVACWAIFGWCLVRRCVAIFGVMCGDIVPGMMLNDQLYDQVKQTRSRTLGQRLRYCNSCSMRADSQHQAQTLQGCSRVMCYWDSRKNLCIFKIKWLMLIHVESMQCSSAVILIYIWFELQIWNFLAEEPIAESSAAGADERK